MNNEKTLEFAIKEKKIEDIRTITENLPVSKIADLLETMTSADRIVFFTLLKTETQAEIFSSLEPEYQKQLIGDFSDSQVKEIIDELYSDEIADLIETLPDELARRIFIQTDKKTTSTIKKLLQYTEDQVGSIMNVDIFIVKDEWTIGETLKNLKEAKDEKRLAHYFFVVDNVGLLQGYISLEDLIFENQDGNILDISKPISHVDTTMNKEIAANIFADSDFSVLPVISGSEQVVGMVTSDEIIDVVQEAAVDDISFHVGLSGIEDKTYSKKSAFFIFKSRIFWLLLLLIPATMSHYAIDWLEPLSEKIFKDNSSETLGAVLSTLLVATIPLFTDSAGNAGSQTSATVIRSLSTGDITKNSYRKVLVKEFQVGLLSGFALGSVNMIRLLIMYSIKGELNFNIIILSVAVSLALFLVIVLAKFLGGILPLIASKFGKDPAVMSSPLLTTLIDTLSILLLFGVSIAIMLLVL